MKLIDFYISEWVFALFNLSSLTLLLTRILWKPVNRILDERQAKIEQGLQDAAAARLLYARCAVGADHGRVVSRSDGAGRAAFHR